MVVPAYAPGGRGLALAVRIHPYRPKLSVAQVSVACRDEGSQ